MSQMIESFMNDSAPARPHARAIAFEELAASAGDGPPLLVQPHPLHGLKVELQVRVGTAAMTLGELLAARENQVLPLRRSLEEPVDLLLDGRTVARGHLVAVGEHFGVRITELPLPLKL